MLPRATVASPDNAGNLFATGFWFEDNKTTAGGGCASLDFINCTIKGNYQRAIMFFSHAGPLHRPECGYASGES